ncbi:MAG: hypothetical protein ACYCT2_00825 [Thermoplasmataceae archaeon]
MVSYAEREKFNFEGSVKIRIIPFGAPTRDVRKKLSKGKIIKKEKIIKIIA